jgi:hypothetical protein
VSGPLSFQSKDIKVRAAMDRLLTGQAIHTDGTLDITTLATEAGVSRQDLYRTCRPLLDEFRTHLRRLEEAGPRQNRHAERAEQLARKLQDATDRAARYRSERDAARRERDVNASQVVYLTEQNRLLREHIEAQANTTPIRS